MNEQNDKAVTIDLLQQSSAASGSGPQWAHESEDLDVTLLAWMPGKSIEEHINNEVDVMLIGVTGSGVVRVDGEPHQLPAGALLLIPKGKRRAMQNGDEQWSYISIHRRRRGLMPTVGGKSLL